MSGADELDEAVALANSGRAPDGSAGGEAWSTGAVGSAFGPGAAPLPAGRLPEGAGVPAAQADACPSAGDAAPDPVDAAADSAPGGGSWGGDAEATTPVDGAERSAPSAGAARTSGAPRHREQATGWEEARACAWAAGGTLPPVTLPLDEALHHTLAAPLRALTDLPPFDTSAMDGWAVAGPGPWELVDPHAAEGGPEAEEESGGPAVPGGAGLLAGDRRAPLPLADGAAVPIATGARVPRGATAVLRSEYGEVRQGQLRRLSEADAGGVVREAPQPGTDIRPRGQECRSGDRLLPAGVWVSPVVLGLAAAAGYDRLDVVRRPRVEILVLGEELLRRGLPEEGRIRDALGPMVAPWLAGLGVEVSAVRWLGDDADALFEAVATSTAELVVTTGGTAAGPVDHLHRTLERLGARLLVDGVRVRPGHPMLLAELPEVAEDAGPETETGSDGAAGRPRLRSASRPAPPAAGKASRGDRLCGVGEDGGWRMDALAEVLAEPGPEPEGAPAGVPRAGRHLVGLPGNPLAALAGLLSLAEPLLRRLGGMPRVPSGYAVLDGEVRGHPVDTRLVPVMRVPGAAVRPLRYSGPAMLRGVAGADALAVVPPGGVAGGTQVELLELPR
ncbi:molybdopterin molybdenumtransferase MoeA [Streptomyces sp. AJS327]|uniref:molybdopterin molybdotransferase MoeA n=1 Tax=Streptomyces sp. AJS327 TaxID=2545265 RepID=UPI0015E00C54|nr:molybdopterin molybdotransferase MoeA [Streptomyces sp. AJS327]MBA0052780.1 molybdopterin molybdenumtransferase MoeA [Streptomyces sp. AJS327]